MAFKFVLLAALVACANAGALLGGPAAYAAGPLAYAAGPAVVTKTIAAAPVLTKTVDAEYDPNPQYSYSYDVADSITGDFKNQHETRNGDLVQGSYSLIEADGTRRIVDYAADSLNGFNAIVRKEPATVAVKAVAAAPVVKTVAAYAAPAPAFAATYAAAPAFAKTIAAPFAQAAYAPAAYAPAAYAPAAYAPYGAPALAKAYF